MEGKRGQTQVFGNRVGRIQEQCSGISGNSISSTHNPLVPVSNPGGPTKFLPRVTQTSEAREISNAPSRDLGDPSPGRCGHGLSAKRRGRQRSTGAAILWGSDRTQPGAERLSR